MTVAQHERIERGRINTYELDVIVQRAGREAEISSGWRPGVSADCRMRGAARPAIEMIGQWGQRWVRSRLTRDELDPGMLMWFIHRHFPAERLPPRRIAIQLEFTNVKRMKRWWLVLESGCVDLCLDDPGFPIDTYLSTDLTTLTEVFMGATSFAHAVSAGKILVDGPNWLTRSIFQWLARSRFADTPSARTVEPRSRPSSPERPRGRDIVSVGIREPQ